MADIDINLDNVVLSVNGVEPDGTGNVTIPGGTDTNMANTDLVLTANRSHDAAGLNWSLTDLRNLKFESTSTAAATPVFGYEFNPGGSVYSDIVLRVMLDGNTTRPPLEIRGDRSVGIGDNAQSNIQLQVYTNSKDKTIAAGNDSSGGKAIDAVANGTNGFGGQFTGQGSGGTGAKALGTSVGMMGQSTSDSGTAIVGQGAAIFKNYDDNSARLDSALLHLKTTDKAHVFMDPITKSQRDSIAPTVGMGVFMQEFDEDEPEGLYLYLTTGWKRVLTDL